MFIKIIKINNLRNLKEVEIRANPALNMLLGDNGAGKTSVLESMVVLAKGRSFRSGQISSLIGPFGDRFTVFADTESARGTRRALGIEREKGSWNARLNGQEVTQLGDLSVHVPLVVIEPNSHQLVSGPPEGRRRYLDWGVFHVEPAHLLHWRRYARSLKQRNAALKRRQRDVIASLDPVLAGLGEKINRGRSKQFRPLVNELSKVLGELSPGLSGIHLEYTKGWRGEHLLDALQESLDRDIERGQTGPGPHRADIDIDWGGHAAREQLSRGEQKVVSASMLLSQAAMMAEAGAAPMLLLDDIASEFDELHLSRLMAYSASLNCQTWVTGTSSKPFEDLLDGPHTMFHVEQGKITRLSRD